MQEADFHFDAYFTELFDADHGHADSGKPHSAHAQTLK